MSTKKSKNNPMNRLVNEKKICPVCEQVKKPIRYVATGSSKMCYECDCGIIDKNDVCMITREELEEALD